jgi:acetylornithine/succinyldiaminopimelate/putrescine aminotransferase
MTMPEPPAPELPLLEPPEPPPVFALAADVEAVETALKLCRKWGYQVKGIPESKAKILWNYADAHRKQCESLPPEKKVKILETNADAHKKKRESLSPEDKDLFEKNHTAAQHKYRKSLSPDQKAQVYTKNAA